MRSRLIRGVGRIVLSAGVAIVAANDAQAQPVTGSLHRPPPVPNCGGPQPAGITLPRSDGQGNRLLYRIVDSAGYDFEIWCRGGVAVPYYEYRISFPDGTWKKIDECELFMGSNVVKLDIDGDSIANDTTPNGAPLERLRGRLRRYRHHNFNTSKDFHTFLDFSTGRVRRFDTRMVKGSDGHKHREVTDHSEWTIEIPRVRPPDTPGTSIAPVHGGTIVRSFAPDPVIGFCTAEDSDSVTVVEHLLSDDPLGPAAYFTGTAGIAEIVLEDGAVTATMVADVPASRLTLVVPVEVGGPERVASVTIDGQAVSSAQSISGALRTVAFELPRGAGTIRIARTRDRLDWRLALLFPLGLLVAWMLTRRRAA